MPAPVLDQAHTATHTGGTAGTVTAITAGPNRVLLLFVEVGTTGATITTSVTSSTLTWAKRSSVSNSALAFALTELWYAVAPLQLTAEVITVTTSGTMDDMALGVAAFTGCATQIFDTNTNFPANTAIVGNNTLTLSVNTDQPNTLILGFAGCNSCSLGASLTLGSGYSLVLTVANSGGSHFATMEVEKRAFTTVQTSRIVDATPTGCTGKTFVWCADAITGDLGTPNAPINLTISNPTSSSLTASWTPATGPVATSFTLQYRTSPSGAWATVTGITSTTYVANGLVPSTAYDFEVAGVNALGTGPYSAIVTGNTLSLGNFGPIPVFPTLPQGFPLKMSPLLDTIIGTTKSLREMRVAQRTVPLWDFELLFEELRDQTQNQVIYKPFTGIVQFTQLVQTWLMMYGQTNVFAFDCPWDDSRSNQQIGTGDGVTFIYTIYRTWGLGAQATLAPVGLVNQVTQVQVNGVTISPTDYTINRNKIQFVNAPGTGQAITMTFSFYYLCRFVEDEQDFEEFGKNRWTVPSIKFRSVYWP